MRQSRSLAQQVFSRPRRIEHFRRRSWAPRRAHQTALAGVAPARDVIPGEFEELPRSQLLSGLKRAICLTSDIMLLTLLSPFFAVWFLYRGALKLGRALR